MPVERREALMSADGSRPPSGAFAQGFTGTQAKITLSLACNNDCRFCYNRLHKSEARPLESGRVKALIDDAASSGAHQLNFIGGEVTILPYFLDVLRHGSGRFSSVSINTNGRRFHDAAFAREAVEAGLTEVDISLHGSHGGIHDAVSRAPGAFAETTAGLRQLTALSRETGKPQVSVTTIILDWNLEDLVAIGQLLRDIGVRSWRIKHAYGALGGRAAEDPNEYIVPYATALPALRRAFEQHGRDLQIAVHDIPICHLGELLELSTIHERHDVANYNEGGLTQVGTVLGRWGETASPCHACAVSASCCHPSPAYIRRFGEGDLVPLDLPGFEALRQKARTYATSLRRGLSSDGQGGRQSSESPEVRAAFARLDEAARRQDWAAVRQAGLGIVAQCPEDPAAKRMLRLAEAHLLDALAGRLERAGQRGRARQTRRVLQLHYPEFATRDAR